MSATGAAGLRTDRKLIALLAVIFGTHLGWYVVLPFFIVVLTESRGLSAGAAGAVLAANSVAILGASLLGGLLSDRVGRRATILIGLGLRAVGLALLAGRSPYFSTLLFALITGLGGGIFASPAKAGIAALASGGPRATAFSLRGMAANLGVTLGPLLGALLVTRPHALFLVAALLHAVLATLTAFLLPPEGGTPDSRPATGAGSALGRALGDRPFLLFSALTVLAWALYTQFTVSVPLRALALLSGPRAIGLLWTASSLTVILLQVPVTRLLAPWPLLRTLALGLLLLGAGLGAVAFAQGFAGLLGAVLVVTLGEMLVMPTVDTVVSELAPTDSLGAYFGIASLVWGLGEAGGNLLGGQLMQRLGGGALPWLIFAATGAALAVLTLALGRLPALRRRANHSG